MILCMNFMKCPEAKIDIKNRYILCKHARPHEKEFEQCKVERCGDFFCKNAKYAIKKAMKKLSLSKKSIQVELVLRSLRK